MIIRLNVIDAPAEQDALWHLYESILRPVNERTPISQMLPRDQFIALLSSPRSIKFLLKEQRVTVGLGVVSEDLELDQLLSIPYIEKHFAGTRVFNFPVIAVAPRHRDGQNAIDLLRAMFAEVPEKGVGIFLHSRNANPMIPRLAELASRGRVRGQELDEEVFCIYQWKQKE